jgi:hypothetical protein
LPSFLYTTLTLTPRTDEDILFSFQKSLYKLRYFSYADHLALAIMTYFLVNAAPDSRKDIKFSFVYMVIGVGCCLIFQLLHMQIRQSRFANNDQNFRLFTDVNYNRITKYAFNSVILNTITFSFGVDEIGKIEPTVAEVLKLICPSIMAIGLATLSFLAEKTILNNERNLLSQYRWRYEEKLIIFLNFIYIASAIAFEYLFYFQNSEDKQKSTAVVTLGCLMACILIVEGEFTEILRRRSSAANTQPQPPQQQPQQVQEETV